MKKVCVVIPIHSPYPTKYELISFQQCLRVFKNRDIVVVSPFGMGLDEYKKLGNSFSIVSIDKKWQKSLMAYNKLKMSKYFYNLFSDYEFLLTYELDAFVFEDNLDYWCNQGYDYIGAPWFDGYDNPDPSNRLIGVGNSGFSLRRISSVKNVLKNVYYKNPYDYLSGRKDAIKADIKLLAYKMVGFFGENYSLQNSGLLEDVFFGTIACKGAESFVKAPVEEAIKFSFEVNPREMLKINNGVLPMGCHAWWRYDLDFWKPYIEAFSYRL
ncbi:hypothetical protein F0P96_12370 [Hymenobacter busanensis]|uniref:Uncharacterized protein n=1 Tax=Hymenobacter busanensis TaxID=2607656 RepID=A0A7L4ZX21_9BACT|nr:DUF5672 family protein [Hymenobacter busanensis]KAA9332268.1 hypothetical protein F0P96_12370 [Hymenobacter busanensis]QHJ07395.1 hypothetical protein GUY19_08905 [Hymenobacter busanensis]